MKKIALLLAFFTFGLQVLMAQTKEVSGKVSSAEDGGAIPGVSVSVKGTTIGTVTDMDGVFRLKVPQDAKTLVLSFVGMTTQEIDLGNQTKINVKMVSENISVDEVVVTAMGISKEKKALGYAVENVGGQELTQAANTNLGTAIQGKVSGIEVSSSSGMPGASTKIQIRGARSFTGNNAPLYIVDGTPISSTPDVGTGNSVTGTDYADRALDIDPGDIESINILKGQAASALYGMRASNGVVVITTKSGKGAGKGKPQLSFTTNFAFDVISTMPEFQNEFAQGTGGAYSPSASTSWGPKIAELANDAKYGGNTTNTYTNKDGMKQGMYYVPQRAKAGLDPWAVPAVYDNAKDFFNTGLTQSNAFNIAQGFDKGNFSLSLGNTMSNGIVPSTGLDRYNAKMSAEAQLSKSWKMGFSGNFVTSKLTKQSSANNGIVATVYPAPPSYDLAGIPSYVKGDPYTQNTYRSTSGFDAAYWAIDNNKFTERSQRFFGNVYAEYNTNLNTENQKLVVKYQLGDDAYATNYSDIWGYGHANAKGEVDQYNYTINEMNSLLTAAYNWKVNDDLVFDAVLGNEWVEYGRKYTEGYGKDFNFSGWNHIDNASVYQASDSYRTERTIGVFGNLALAYKSMLYLNATGRNDIVSTMPRNNRSFFYPSVSLGWIFTELESLKNEILTYGKLRSSYAEVGQAGNYYNSYFSTPVYGGGFSSGTPILYPINGVVAYTPYSTVYDPNLKPQNTVSYEFGADLTFFKGIVNFSYTYSRQNVKDQIFSVPLASSTGSSSLVTNGGSIHTNSHEVTLGVNPIKTKNFKWDFAFNFSKIDNYVDKLAPGVNSIFLGGFTEPQVRAGIGDKFPVIYGVSYLRNDAGQIVVDADGMPQSGEEKVIGSVSPDFRLGFNTSFTVFKFRLSALFDWKNGGQMYSGTAGLLDYYGKSKRSGEYRKSDSFLFEKPAVKVTGTDSNGNPTYATNDIKISGADAQTYFSNLNNISESMIYDNSFVKMREIALNYPLIDKSGLKVNINVFARNIIVWSKMKGLDPESTQGNTNMSGAFERFSLPGAASYGFGLNLNF
ncbi:TonB-dependent outer membrane receptor [Aquipluma nitroreducens]|uniref:TonB-dependent outer membrane receptor n=1 Tax=Aquipluma nitroreducens TaxID=2010828 RepID=A0A5K7S6R9_9BACT|nr:SusC/RagA family TonB-linked outer membrane protein [Aquipluma nitroreducens]BBE17232.1 TonB-dependent outer membrane receptor [Aquipluma nitroreducens]